MFSHPRFKSTLRTAATLLFALIVLLSLTATLAAQRPTLGSDMPKSSPQPEGVSIGYTLTLPLIAHDYVGSGPQLDIDIEVEQGGTFGLLEGAILVGESATVRISLNGPAVDPQVTLIPDVGSPLDLTSLFSQLDSGQAAAQFDLFRGRQLLRVENGLAGNRSSQEASLMALPEPGTLFLSSVAAPFVETDEIPYPHETGMLALYLTDNVTPAQLAELLRNNQLRLLDYDPVIGIARALIEDGRSPLQLGHQLTESPLIEVAGPNFEIETRVAIGEDMPTALSSTYSASAGAGCSGAGRIEGCFDYSGDAVDALDLYRYHFFFDTFAGHRLVEHLVPSRSVSPTIAILDGGLTIAGANPLDIPVSEIVRPTSMRTTRGFDNNGLPLDITGAPVPMTLASVADTSGHGTRVTAAAAGRGTTNLGTGRDLLVRPVQRRGGAPRTAIAMAMLALDDDVVAVNGSFGLRLDRNRDGRVTQAERDWIRINVVPGYSVAMARGFAALNAPYRDLDGSSTYTAGEPFGDTNGNGTYDGQGDAKIYVIAAGNDGTSVGLESYPEFLVPGHAAARPAGSNLLMAVSSVETQTRYQGGEMLSNFSTYGPQISVAASGGNVALPGHNGAMSFRNGNSYAAPQVTGLAGEMIYLDSHLFAPGSRLSPRQIVEMIEATADDLGTSVTGDNRFRNNNDPANGSDDFFGHGRINVWKALLSVANRGVASESHPGLNARFPNLTAIDADSTRWYGFKMHAPMRGTTVWIDGVRIDDAGSDAPGGINAYAGVKTNRTVLIGVDMDKDRATDEDTTSGVVPLGSQSHFIATFSIQKEDLVKAGGLRSLQLRRPGQTAKDAPFFTLDLDLAKMRKGEIPGVNFDDFVFEITPPDFGDAKIGPTRLSDDGARHVNSLHEYFGRANATFSLDAVSAEHDVDDPADVDGVSNWELPLTDLDGKDDGIVHYPLTYLKGEKGRVDVQVCISESGDRYSATDLDKQIFVNGWLDWNTNGSWEEGASGEHILDGLRLAPIEGTPAGWAPRSETADHVAEVTLLSSNSDCANYKVTFDVPEIGRGELWSRFRLDYGENVGRHDNSTYTNTTTLSLTLGSALYGEVSDFVIGPDFGDAGPDAPWPTTLDKGPRHLSFFREWIGAFGPTPSASREPRACKSLGADEDGVDNLGTDCKGRDMDEKDDFTARIIEPGKIEVTFEIASTIGGYGYDGANPGVMTLGDQCKMVPLAGTPETPDDQQVEMRYDARNPEERLYVNLFADWNGDGSFEATVLSAPVDPESFGKDGVYTLGEPFDDANGDGVWTTGESFTDVAGVPSKTFTCVFDAPVPAPAEVTQWLRMRLDYGENVGAMIRRSDPFEEDPLHAPTRELKGAVWGEVEDLPLTGMPEKRCQVPQVEPGQTFPYEILVPAGNGLTTTATARITDPLPQLVEYVGTVGCSFGVCSYDEKTHTVTAVGPIEPLQVHHLVFEVKLKEEIPPTITEIINRATVFNGVEEVVVQDTTPIHKVPRLFSSVTVVQPGQTFHYMASLPGSSALEGPADAHLTNKLAQEVQFAGQLSCSLPGECLYDQALHQVMWFGTLDRGQELIVQYAAQVGRPPECVEVIESGFSFHDGFESGNVGHTLLFLCE